MAAEWMDSVWQSQLLGNSCQLSYHTDFKNNDRVLEFYGLCMCYISRFVPTLLLHLVTPQTMSVTNGAVCRGGAIVYCFDTPVPFLKTVHLDQLVPVKDGRRIMETSECLIRHSLPENDQGMIRCLVMLSEPLLTKSEVEKKFLDDDALDEIRWHKKGQQWTQDLELKVTALVQANPLPQNQNPPHTVAAVLPDITNTPQSNALVHPNANNNAHHVSHPEPSTSQIIGVAITGHVADTEVEPAPTEVLRSLPERKNATASLKTSKRKHTVPATTSAQPAKRGRSKSAVRSAPSKLPVTQKVPPVSRQPSGPRIPSVSVSENSDADETWRQMDVKSLIFAEPTFDRAVRKGLMELFTEEELQSAAKKLASKNQKNFLDGFRLYFLTDLLMLTALTGILNPKMNRTEVHNRIVAQVLDFSTK